MKCSSEKRCLKKRKEVDAYKQILKAKIKVEDAQEAVKAAEKRKGDKKE